MDILAQQEEALLSPPTMISLQVAYSDTRKVVVQAKILIFLRFLPQNVFCIIKKSVDGVYIPADVVIFDDNNKKTGFARRRASKQPLFFGTHSFLNLLKYCVGPLLHCSQFSQLWCATIYVVFRYKKQYYYSKRNCGNAFSRFWCCVNQPPISPPFLQCSSKLSTYTFKAEVLYHLMVASF